jgi:hypothetical protein
MERVFEARQRYFAENGFSDAGYNDRWVKLSLGRLPLVMPNPPSRRRAIPLHDLHHVATGYDTTLRGEAEISAWELGAGCGSYTAARLYGLGGVAVGLAIAPRRTYRAFVRGRHSTSLYRSGWSNDLLDLQVDALRARLHLDARPRPTTWRDRVAFAACAAAAIVPPVGIVALALRL